jgi:hypothetical protein
LGKGSKGSRKEARELPLPGP